MALYLLSVRQSHDLCLLSVRDDSLEGAQKVHTSAKRGDNNYCTVEREIIPGDLLWPVYEIYCYSN